METRIEKGIGILAFLFIVVLAAWMISMLTTGDTADMGQVAQWAVIGLLMFHVLSLRAELREMRQLYDKVSLIEWRMKPLLDERRRQEYIEKDRLRKQMNQEQGPS